MGAAQTTGLRPVLLHRQLAWSERREWLKGGQQRLRSGAPDASRCVGLYFSDASRAAACFFPMVLRAAMAGRCLA